MDHLDDLRERMCKELDDIPVRGTFSRNELEDAFKLIYSLKGIRALTESVPASPTVKHYDEQPQELHKPEPQTPTGEEHLTMEQAKDWLGKMQNADGTTGPHWSYDQATQLMTQRNLTCNPVDFWVALCMMYSDYSKVARAYSADNPNFYADMAAAFLCDEDAVKDKLVQYWEHIPAD